MRCVFCSNYFDLDKAEGINYREKGICEHCLKGVMIACLLKHRDGIKRFIHMTIQEQGHMVVQ